jgi:threonyl-tRNA synthetase
MGVLIEHYAGAMPFWLAPLQVKILPISDKFIDHARTIEKQLRLSGIRAEIDDRNEKIGYKIRDAEVKKIPYMAIVGEKELAAGAVSVRRHGKGDLGSVPLQEFIALLQQQSAPDASL